MKKFLLTCAFCTVAVLSLSAKIWRINNNPGIPAHFNNGQDAHNAASAGDTLYFESSPTAYPDFTIRKQLTVMGMGAFLDNYPGYQIPGAKNANIIGINIKPGGNGTVITGIEASNIRVDTVSNIFINRNSVGGISFTGVASSNITYNYSNYVSLLRSSSVTIHNNIMTSQGNALTVNHESSNIVIYRNSILGGIGAYNASISNNIMNSASLQSCNFTYNVLVSSSYLNNSVTINSGGNNIFGQSRSNIFAYEAAYASTDKYYDLKIGSPAIGAASDGGDCGATGGANPYVFNALQPAIPSIYKLVVPGVVTGNTLPITISTRANN